MRALSVYRERQSRHRAVRVERVAQVGAAGAAEEAALGVWGGLFIVAVAVYALTSK